MLCHPGETRTEHTLRQHFEWRGLHTTVAWVPLYGDKILVNRKKNSKHELEFMGPFPITQINENGTVRFQKGIINDATNIRRIKPFFD